MPSVETPSQQHGCNMTSLIAVLLMVVGGAVGYSLGIRRGIGLGLLGVIGGAFGGVIATGLLLTLLAFLATLIGGRDTPNGREE